MALNFTFALRLRTACAFKFKTAPASRYKICGALQKRPKFASLIKAAKFKGTVRGSENFSVQNQSPISPAVCKPRCENVRVQSFGSYGSQIAP